MRTSAPHVFAAGDVTGRHLFTHVAAYEGRIAGQNAAGKRQRADYRVVPWVTFLDPEVAPVGITEPQARHEHGTSRWCARAPSCGNTIVSRDRGGG
jgi:pyruvate/2-oxoglutarate dehydrogenase complex dihydrolipoamide dehydrogenase (E3) component